MNSLNFNFKLALAFSAALLTLATLGCTHKKVSTDPAAQASLTQQTKKISFLTFNVENLFDTENNPEKNDEAFLPKSTKSDPIIRNNCYVQNDREFRQDECLSKDWSEKILSRKFRRITDVLKQVQGGIGPDVLILQEVENVEVLKQWRDGYLQKMGYQTIALVEGSDLRGIDTAVMSRLPLVGSPILHQIVPIRKVGQPPLSADSKINPDDNPAEFERATRGILQADLKLPNGQTLSVFSVHFPAQGNPTEYRKHAVETLLGLVKNLPNDRVTIAGGDFNITSTEDWEHRYFKELIAKEMAVSHLVGCAGCVGTTYYHKTRTWSFFDVLLFSKDLLSENSNWRLNTGSIHIVNNSVYQISRYGSPARFGTGLGPVGVSDHWPVYAEIEYQPKNLVGARK